MCPASRHCVPLSPSLWPSSHATCACHLQIFRHRRPLIRSRMPARLPPDYIHHLHLRPCPSCSNHPFQTTGRDALFVASVDQLPSPSHFILRHGQVSPVSLSPDIPLDLFYHGETPLHVYRHVSASNTCLKVWVWLLSYPSNLARAECRDRFLSLSSQGPRWVARGHCPVIPFRMASVCS